MGNLMKQMFDMLLVQVMGKEMEEQAAKKKRVSRQKHKSCTLAVETADDADVDTDLDKPDGSKAVGAKGVPKPSPLPKSSASPTPSSNVGGAGNIAGAAGTVDSDTPVNTDGVDPQDLSASDSEGKQRWLPGGELPQSNKETGQPGATGTRGAIRICAGQVRRQRQKCLVMCRALGPPTPWRLGGRGAHLRMTPKMLPSNQSGQRLTAMPMLAARACVLQLRLPLSVNTMAPAMHKH